MVWFAYEQWKRVKEGFRTCPMLPSHKQLDMQVHVLFPEANAASKSLQANAKRQC